MCDGYLRVANANMVKAIGSISIAKGCDPREYAMVAFGGAAGQHACAVAAELGMRQVLLHPDAGILSAYGIGRAADVIRHAARGVYQAHSRELVESLAVVFSELSDEALGEVLAEGIAPDRVEVRRSLDLRYRGLDAWLTIPEPTDGDYAEAYAEAHERLYGYRNDGREIEIVAARVEVIGHTVEPEPAVASRAARGPSCPAHDDDLLRRPNRCRRASSTASGCGPVIRSLARRSFMRRRQPRSSIPAGGAKYYRAANCCCTRQQSVPSADAEVVRSRRIRQKRRVPCDPAMLEVFNNRFAAIAEQMGITLRNTSSSVNVKERLDFSCAVFAATGDLVVNAPHIPVHLGAMGETVKRILADNPDLGPGDVFVTNDPYRGGSHLPDVTVVTPVFAALGTQLLFFTASRAHHAEIGGIRPGSMPPFSQNLAEEGVLIRNFQLVAAGRSRFDEFAELLRTAKYPTRKLTDNLADVAAKVAANQNKGARTTSCATGRASFAADRAGVTCAIFKTPPSKRCGSRCASYQVVATGSRIIWTTGRPSRSRSTSTVTGRQSISPALGRCYPAT